MESLSLQYLGHFSANHGVVDVHHHHSHGFDKIVRIYEGCQKVFSLANLYHHHVLKGQQVIRREPESNLACHPFDLHFFQNEILNDMNHRSAPLKCKNSQIINIIILF